MHQKMHLINSLINMPVAAEPGIVVQFAFQVIQPFFRAVIYQRLIQAGHKSFSRHVLLWTCVRKNAITLKQR